MNILKKLDRSSKVLILIALLGILGSVISIYQVSNLADSGGGKDKVASITVFNKDTRLKRSGNIHWYSVSQPLDAFEDDRIFTGKDSYATIEFASGGKVTLLPNSLISLSKGYIQLNSGTIEVDLKKGAVGIESFGERFNPTEKTKFRLENSAKVKRIVPLEDKQIVSLENNVKLKEFLKPEQITIARPSSGEQIPKFSDNDVTFSWRASATANYKVEYSTSKDFANIFHSVEVTTNSLRVSSATFPEGLLYWRVTEVKTNSKAESSFNMVTNIDIRLINPTASSSFPSKQVASEGLVFEWTNDLRYPQKMQLSLTKDFSNVINDSDVQGTQRNLKISTDGTFFWRVGYAYGNGRVHWSETSSFKVTPEVTIAPLEIIALNKEMDFSLTKQYLVRINDLNKCDEYEFIITSNDKVVSNTVTNKPGLKINKLENGDYQLKVIGKLNSKNLTESGTETFTVKNSPPLKAPRIKNKKNVKLFVKALKGLFDFIMPSAEAAPAAYYLLQWEEEEGASYEVEVAKEEKDEKKIVISEKTNEGSFKFFIEGPDRYFWRVRSEKNGQWSPFSEYAEIQVEDKISKVVAPLMVSPPNGKVLKANKKGVRVKFKWNEPSRTFKYFLEITPRGATEPSKVLEVSGGSVGISEDDLPENFSWRVYAESRFDNRTTNEERWNVTFYRLLEAPKPPAIFILRPNIAQSKTNFKQDYENASLTDIEDEIDFSGPILNLNFEYLFSRWNHKRSLVIDFRKTSFTDADNELEEQRLGAEYGWLGNRKLRVNHSYYAGFSFNSVKFGIGPEVSADYGLSYITGRYVYTRHLSNKYVFLMNAGLFIPVPDLNVPSFSLKPVLSYKFKKNLWFDAFTVFERIIGQPTLEGGGTSDKITTETQTMALGLGLTWFSGL